MRYAVAAAHFPVSRATVLTNACLFLQIGRPKSYTGPNIAIGGSMASALNMDLTASMLSSPFLPAMPTAASVPRATPTPILRMSNMVTKEELADDEEYGEICEDVVEELAKFGKVRLTYRLHAC